VKANQDTYPVGVMCRLLQVSTSGFYGWRDRPPSAHAREDIELGALIRDLYDRSYGTYGARRIRVELMESCEVRTARKRVARLMRRAGLQGVQKKRFRCTTRGGASKQWAPDLVERNFRATRPDVLWVADATYVSTGEGFLYLAMVLDVFSRRVIGWAMADRISSALVLAALEMARMQRETRTVIHHSDHGSEYTAIAFGARCGELGVRLSMGSVGDCYDNAMAESFFASLECEVLDRERFATRATARLAIFRWIEGWYNTRRRHSSLGYLSPLEFERRYAERRTSSSKALLPHSRQAAFRGRTRREARPE